MEEYLSFSAASSEHAIVEVVFGILLARPWSPREISRLVASVDGWKHDLPRMSQLETHQFQMGPAGIQPVQVVPVNGISFERIRPDGELGWRLRCEGNALFINCLEYTRWTEVWQKARGYLRKAFDIGVDPDQAIVGVMLQYVDMFTWDGAPNDYDVTHLLNVTGELVPTSLRDHGAVWHLHAGWFEQVDEPVPGRLLNRVHFDALADGTPSVRMDTLLRKDVSAPLPRASLLEENSRIDELMIWLHDRNKLVLRKYLISQVQEAIGLVEVN